MVGEHHLAEALLHDISRLVPVHEHLLQDDLPLGVHLVGPECRLTEDVAQDVEAEVEVLGEGADVEGGVLLRRVGVHVAADGINRLGDLPRRAVLGPLEQEVLEEVRDARLGSCLVSGAGAHPDPDGGRGDIAHRLGYEAEARPEP